MGSCRSGGTSMVLETKIERRNKVKRNKELFIEVIGQIAQEDWRRRHICLPSIVIAITLEAIDWEKNETEIDISELFIHRKDFRASSPILKHVIMQHNDYLATWRAPSQEEANWEGLMGEGYYIRAVQFLQDVKHPYCESLEYERVLVEIIEKYKLTAYDE